MLALATLAAGCARPAPRPAAALSPSPPGDAAPDRDAIVLVPDGYTGRFRAFGTVLENVSADGPKHGPQLCGGVQQSLPPQCSGLDVADWSWSAVPHESAQGAKWGDYEVIVTLDAGRNRLTLKATPVVPVPPTGDPTVGRPEPNTPCPAPPGGWRPVDPTRATDGALQAAVELARGSKDFAGVWIDQNQPVVTERTANDPTKLILTVAYRTDLARHEAELRQVWGGALCVVAGGRTHAELLRILRETVRLPGVRGGGVDEIRNAVSLDVWVAWQSRQRELDSRYGSGAVRQEPLLKPIDLSG